MTTRINVMMMMTTDLDLPVPLDGISRLRELLLRNHGVSVSVGSATVALTRDKLVTKAALVTALACVMTR